jgi:hypothetical protein
MNRFDHRGFAIPLVLSMLVLVTLFIGFLHFKQSSLLLQSKRLVLDKKAYFIAASAAEILVLKFELFTASAYEAWRKGNSSNEYRWFLEQIPYGDTTFDLVTILWSDNSGDLIRYKTEFLEMLPKLKKGEYNEDIVTFKAIGGASYGEWKTGMNTDKPGTRKLTKLERTIRIARKTR